MSITSDVCNSFKEEILTGVHDLSNDTLKIALIKENPSGTYDADITNYSDLTGNSDEVVGTNYTAGGNDLDSVTITKDNSTDVVFVDFENETFSNVTLSTDGAIIYNATRSNKAIAIINFLGTVSATAGDLTIQFPAAAYNTAIIRLI